jgi:hypothetical protein
MILMKQPWDRFVSSLAGEAQEELATEERNFGEEYTTNPEQEAQLDRHKHKGR